MHRFDTPNESGNPHTEQLTQKKMPGKFPGHLVCQSENLISEEKF
jgi:hypothetical protein